MTMVGLFGHLALDQCGDPGRAWLESALAETSREWNRSTFIVSFAQTTLELGKDLLELSPEERMRVEAAGAGSHLHRWWRDELGRVALLLTAANSAADGELEAIIEDFYWHGENRERQAILRALPLLPRPERFLTIGIDACRSSIQPIFESIACENRFPADHFPELSFNQMVLKALFNGVALERVVGLPQRATPELVRMAAAFAQERRAAGRPVPDDIERHIIRARGLQ